MYAEYQIAITLRFSHLCFEIKEKNNRNIFSIITVMLTLVMLQQRLFNFIQQLKIIQIIIHIFSGL